MKYLCGHEGCDICGARQCAGMRLSKHEMYFVCDYCLIKAIKYAYEAACQFGGTIIDPNKPCAQEESQ